MHTRNQLVSQEPLFRALLEHDVESALQAIEDARGSEDVHWLHGLSSMHFAAAMGCAPVLSKLKEGGVSVDEIISTPDVQFWEEPLWFQDLWRYLTSEQRTALSTPGTTPLAMASRRVYIHQGPLGIPVAEGQCLGSSLAWVRPGAELSRLVLTPTLSQPHLDSCVKSTLPPPCSLQEC